MRIQLKKLNSSNTKNLTKEGIRICNNAQLEIVLLNAPKTLDELRQAVEAPGLTFLATSEKAQALKDWIQFKQELEDLDIYKEVSFLTFDAIQVPDCYSTGELILPERVEAIRSMVDVIDPCIVPTCYFCEENQECFRFMYCSILYDSGYRRKDLVEKQTAERILKVISDTHTENIGYTNWLDSYFGNKFQKLCEQYGLKAIQTKDGVEIKE